MQNLQIEILKPEVRNLLEELVKLDLIRIKEVDNSKSTLLDVVNKLRSQSDQAPSDEEIQEEVEIVRSRRYSKNQ